MSLYKCCEWEENRYDDSDFKIAVWDDEKNVIQSIEIGSTRYAGGISYPELTPWNPKAIEDARQYLENRIFDMIRRAEHNDVMEPNTITTGVRVRLKEKQRNQAKEWDEIKCEKCGGTGHWYNPKNRADTRLCFACKGKGFFRKNFRKKMENGKIVWNNFAPGTAGVVTNVSCYETVYANGYNKKDKHNLMCTVETDDGQEYKALLIKLRLDKEPMSDDELRGRSKELSLEFNPKSLCTMHGGWLSSNEARAYWEEIHAAEIADKRERELVIMMDSIRDQSE